MFPGGVVAVVGGVSQSVLQSWFDFTRFCTTVRVSMEE